MNIVCDTNVLVSAMLFGGPPRQVLQSVIEGKSIGFTSPELRLELADVLGRKKFALTPEQIASIMQLIGETFIEITPTAIPEVIEEDPDDNMVLACATMAKAICIVSGDQHLLKLGSYEEIIICTPADFLVKMAGGT